MEGQCPIDHLALKQHRYTMLAVVPIDPASDSDRVASLLRALNEEDWMSLAGRSRLELGQDLLEVYLLSCPNGRLSWVAVRSPFEYLEPPEIVATAPVSDEGQQGLRTPEVALALDWRDFPS